MGSFYFTHDHTRSHIIMNEIEINEAVREALMKSLGLDRDLHVAVYELSAVDSASVPISKDVHNRLKSVKGIYLDSNNPTLLGKRGSFSLRINGQSLFSSDTRPPSRSLMSNHGVSPNSRYFYFKEIVSQSITLDFEHTDTDTADTTFAAYKVFIFLIGDKK